MQALEPVQDEGDRALIDKTLNEVVRSYGGDPNDSRQRLDNLLEGKRHW